MAEEPNYFFAIPITNEAVISNVVKLQESLVAQQLTPEWNGLKDTGIYKDAMIPAPKLHLTLKVLHLTRPMVNRITTLGIQIFSQIQKKIKDEPLVLDIKGLKCFGTNDNATVLFADIKDPDQAFKLNRIHLFFEDMLYHSYGIPKDCRPFHPHITIGKVKGIPSLQDRGITSFPQAMWSHHQNTQFGSQVVTTFGVYDMEKTDREGGYKPWATYEYVPGSSSTNYKFAIN